MTRTYEVALARFLEALTNRELEHNKEKFPTLKPGKFSVNPGRVFDKIVITRNEHSHSVYAFIRKSNGAILKPGSWRAPEPKKYERGNIDNENPLLGTGIYGVDYIR